MKLARVFFIGCFLFAVAALAGGAVWTPVEGSPAVGRASIAQEGDKLVYADFESVKENRPVSSRGGSVQLFSYQERPTVVSRYKGQEGSNPPAPEFVRLKKDDPNRAIAFDYELQAPNQWA